MLIRTTIFLLLISLLSVAQAETITVTQRYLMGDNDSRNDARQVCFLLGKRKILEKAGTFISSNTKVSLGRLEQDDITSIAGSILSVETKDENWSFAGENMAVTLTLQADVDSKKMDKELRSILDSSSAQKQIAEQRRDLNQLERKITKLQSQLANADGIEAGALRKQRTATFTRIDEVEARRISIVKRINTQTASISKLSFGMTEEEIISLSGQPTSRSRGFTHVLKLRYGISTLFLENGVLS